MKRADLLLEQGTSESYIPLATTDRNGNYSFTVDTPGGYLLWVHGVHHQTIDVPLIVPEKPDTIRLDIRLPTPDYAATFDSVRAIGSFNGFSTEKGAVGLSEQPDGQYQTSVPIPDDSLAYQLLGVQTGYREDEHYPVSGMKADRYVLGQDRPFWDEGSDYFSVIEAPHDSVVLTFDPSELPRSNRQTQIHSNTPQAERLARLHRKKRRLEERVLKAYYKHRQAGESDYDYPWPKVHQRYRKKIRSAETPLIRQYLMLVYFSELHPPKSDSLLARRALEEIPPTSPLWSLKALSRFGASNAIFRIARIASTPMEVDRYMERVYKHHPDPAVQAQFLHRALEWADDLDNEAAEGRRFTRLQNQFKDTYHYENARKIYSPKRRVQAGKGVPEFSLSSVSDTTNVYTNKDLKGKIYLIDFWATWCAPCIEEMKYLHQAHEKYKDQGFTILSVSLDRSVQRVREFRADEWPMPWLNAIETQGFESDLAEKFEVGAIPKQVLVNRSGEIIVTGEQLRGKQLDQTLRNIFQDDEEY